MKQQLKPLSAGPSDRRGLFQSPGKAILTVLLSATLFMMLSRGVAAEEQEITPAFSRGTRSKVPCQVNPTAHRSLFQRLFVRPSWNQALLTCHNPHEVCRTVGRYVSYRRERIDHWNTADETWRSGRGDCEDFAITIMEMCRQLGIETHMELFFPYGRGSGHAVVVGKWHGKLWMCSVGDYSEVTSEEDIAAKVASELWCDKDHMWHVTLTYDDVQRKIVGCKQTTPSTAGPVE